MKRQLRATMLVALVLLVSALVLSACGGSGGSSSGGETAIKGVPTKVDTNAKTFTIDSGGKSYDFKMASGSKGDMNEIKQHADQKKEIEVRYKGSAAPYEVVSAD